MIVDVDVIVVVTTLRPHECASWKERLSAMKMEMALQGAREWSKTLEPTISPSPQLFFFLLKPAPERGPRP